MTTFLHDITCLFRRTARAAAVIVVAAGTAGAAGTAWAQEPVQGDIESGARQNSMCIGCHGIPGYKASFPEVYSVPMIAGQNEQYIIVALRAYASGERSHPTMNAISTSLSEQDMADLAAYYANLK